MANRAAQLDAEIRQAHQNATVKRRGRNFIEHVHSAFILAEPVTIDGEGVRQSGIDITGQNYVTVNGQGLLRLQGHTGTAVIGG